MGFYSGQIVTVKGERYEILRVDFYNNFLTCQKFNSIDIKLFDFSIDEVEE